MSRKADGVITVWLALSLAVITGLFLMLLESARTAGTEWYLDLAARSATDSLFADYHRELWDRYAVFGLEEYAEKEITDELYAYIYPYRDPQKNDSWVRLDIRPEDIRVTDAKTLLFDDGKLLSEEILSYMRFAWIMEAGTEVSAKEILSKAQRERTEEDVPEWIGRMSEAATGMADYSARICREADHLRGQKDLLVRAAENGDGPGFSERAAEMRESAETILSLAGGCQKVSERYDAETADHRENAGDTEELRQKLDALTMFARQLLRDLDAAEEFSEAAQREEDAEEDADNTQIRELWEETVTAAEALPMPDDHWKTRSGDAEKLSQLKKAGERISGNFLSAVLPEGASVSADPIVIPEAPSLLFTEGTNGEFSLTDRLLLAEYVLRKTERFRKGASGEKLQAEYILYGKENDRENLSACVAEGMAIRTGEGLLALLSDAAKRKEAEALAVAVTGGMPGTMEAMTFFLLALWAAWQAASDVKTLLSGGKVPAFRTAAEFSVSLSDILSGGFSAAGEECGIDAREALRLLLSLHMGDRQVMRMADVMQYELTGEQEDFRMQRMTAGLTAVISARSAHIFSVGGTYETSVTVTRSYD